MEALVYIILTVLAIIIFISLRNNDQDQKAILIDKVNNIIKKVELNKDSLNKVQLSEWLDLMAENRSLESNMISKDVWSNNSFGSNKKAINNYKEFTDRLEIFFNNIEF
jgi:hypothetical protein